MRVVLDIGDWILAEDDAGEVRLWSNRVTAETRSYEDIPPEVAAVLSADSNQGEASPAAAKPEVSFQRQRGGAATSSPTEETQPPVQGGFQRQRGRVATSTAAANETLLPETSSTLLPEPSSAAPHEHTLAAGNIGLEHAEEMAMPPSFDEEVPGGDAGLSRSEPNELGRSMAASGIPPTLLLEPPAPAPSVDHPADLIDAPAREPSQAMLVKATSMRQHQGQSAEQFLVKLTHLHLAQHRLTSLGEATRLCPKVRVLYLEGNRIQRLPAVHRTCESLLVQSNDIWELSDWTQNLPNLRTLDLSNNRLSVFSGLDSCNQLEDLSLRGQRSTSPLYLHPPTLQVMARSLSKLDVARNRMTDLSPLAVLSCLERLDAGENEIVELSALNTALTGMRRLSNLRLQENPLCRWLRRYRDEVVTLAGPCLSELDGKAVTPTERQFLAELQRRRRNSSTPPLQPSSAESTPKARASAGEGIRRSASVGASTRVGRQMSRPMPVFAPAAEQPRPPLSNAPMYSQPRSRSSSCDPAARHYRKKSTTTKLPPLPPRI
mmetsp:Transcript_30103/g.55651  ORF Transcript_30103/g.55651 Transcript_30103/m.55651 type:complete len:548 (-) Transcript_30103:100-1743(-)